MRTFPTDLKERLIKLRKNKKSPVTFIMKQYGVSRKTAEGYIAEVMQDEPSDLVFKEAYTYNQDNDTYIVNIKAAAKPLVIKGEVHRAILKNYSNWVSSPLSVNQICSKFKIPKIYFNEYRKIFGLTHDREPLTKEEILSSGVEDSVEKLFEEKRFAIHQQFEKEDWRRTQEDAGLWRAFKAKQIDPLKGFLESWNPPTYSAIKNTLGQGLNYFVCVLSDLHFGARADQGKSFLGKGNSTKEVEANVLAYAAKIRHDVQDRKVGFKKCVLLSNGDICHTLNGFTDKGTMLKFDRLREPQFESAFDTLKLFIEQMLATFQEVEVHAVEGNHSAFMDWVLFETLKAYFRTEKRIVINNHKTQHAVFLVSKSLVLMTHGYSAEYKARLPHGAARETYIQNLLLSKPELLPLATSRIVVTSDLHHIEQKEYANFHHIMTSTAVNGDEYAEAGGFCGSTSKPSQQAFVVNQNGLKETLNYYF